MLEEAWETPLAVDSSHVVPGVPYPLDGPVAEFIAR